MYWPPKFGAKTHLQEDARDGDELDDLSPALDCYEQTELDAIVQEALERQRKELT